MTQSPENRLQSTTSFKTVQFKKGTVTNRNFENPDWEDIEFEDTFFGEGTNKWLIKAGHVDRALGIEIFTCLEDLDKFVGLFLNGYPVCYYFDMNYDENDNGSPTFLEGKKDPKKTKTTFFKIFVIQKYCEKPQLIEGHKHRLRVYALITHDHKAYYFEEWYTAICAVKFDIKSMNYTSLLTNQDVNFKLPEQIKGTITHCLPMKQTLEHVTVDERLNREIVKMMFDSVFVDGVNKLNPKNFPGAFELYGLDILYDQNNKPWFLECNEFPTTEGRGNYYFAPYEFRLFEDMFKLTIDKIFPQPANGKRLGMKFKFLDFPDDQNLWTLLADYTSQVKPASN